MTPLYVRYTETIKITFPSRLFEKHIMDSLDGIVSRINFDRFVIGITEKYTVIEFIRSREYNREVYENE